MVDVIFIKEYKYMTLVAKVMERLNEIEKVPQKMDVIEEGKKTAHTQLTKSGWVYDDEAKAYKHPEHEGHVFVNWKNAIHHLKDNEHVSTVSHWSKATPVDELPKYLTKTFGRKSHKKETE
jgi:hypothetical protein